MKQSRMKYYLRNSIRFRVLCCVLISVTLGLTLARMTEQFLSRSVAATLGPDARLGVMFFLGLFYSVLLLVAQISIMLQPITNLNRRLCQLKTRSEIRRLDPSEFVELGPLLETALDFIAWAENQQNLFAALHHAFRKRIEHLAEYDALTGLYNRHYLQTLLPLQVAHTANLKDRLSVIMLDVDHFKHYNDTNGHPEGDHVLAQVAEILRDSVRDQDVCCRYGGEEFLVTLPNANCEQATVIAERIRQAIAQTPFPYGDRQPTGRLTASLGVASYPAHGATPDELVECADQALYLAKRQGRNCTRTYADVVAANSAATVQSETAS